MNYRHWFKCGVMLVLTLYSFGGTLIKQLKNVLKRTFHKLLTEWSLFIVVAACFSAYDRDVIFATPNQSRFGSESITFMGINTVKKWDRIETYGAKLVENIVQATSRDLLAEAMRRLEATENTVVMHIHDEAVIDAPSNRSLDTMVQLMTEVPDWANGLILNAAGFVSDFYKKD